MKTKLRALLEEYRESTDKKQKDLLKYQIEGELTRILSSTGNSYSEYLGDIVLTIAMLMQSERVSLMVRKGNFLEIAASHGLPDHVMRRRSLVRLGIGIAGKVAEEGEPIITEDITRHVGIKESSIGGSGFKCNVFMCLPLKHDGTVLGVINVSNPIHGESYKESDYGVLKKIADRIAILLHKSRKFEAAKHG